MVQVKDGEGLSHPVQCETNPTGLGGVVVWDNQTPTSPAFYTRTRFRQPDEFSLQVQYETDPLSLNRTVVYDDRIYAISSDENHHIPNQALSVYNSTGVSGGSQQQWSREYSPYNQDEDLLFRPHGHLTSGGSQLSPFYWRETSVPITWWSQKGPWVVMTLAAVMIFFIFIVAKYICS